jgi:hypothetical protein
MNKATRLEKQKVILLERIRRKREEYRLQLMPEDKRIKERYGIHEEDEFPRSTTFKILTRHPYFLLIAVAALTFAGPRKSLIAALTSTAMAALKRYGMSYLFSFGR